jgi:copper chaperone CopZ
MKTFLTALVIAITTAGFAQDPSVDPSDRKKFAELDIHTSTVCDMCEKTIEENMIYEKGVKSVTVDLATNSIHLEYDAKKTDPDKLRLAVTKLGYYADDLPGDPIAFKGLPACCQKEGCGKPVEKK